MSDSRSRLSLSKDDAARVQAVEELAARGAGGVTALVAQLDDTSWAVRRAVVGALARAGAPAIAPLASVIVHQRDNEARLAAAVDALAASRADVEAAMLALIQPASAPAVICDAVQVLGRRKSQAAVPTLERLTTGADDNVALAAIEALSRIGGGAGVTTLIALVAEGNFFRTFPALEVLGASGDRRAVEPLLSALKNPLFAVDAVRALGHTGDERAVPHLLDRLRDAHDVLVRAAAVALVEIYERVHARVGSGASIEAALRGYAAASFAADRAARCLDSADPVEQVAICRVLGWLAVDNALPALFALLAAPSPVAQAATAALKQLGRAIDRQLMAQLRTADSEVRLHLLSLVAGNRAGLDAVVACLDDADPAVRHAACAALARSGDAAVTPRLFALLADEDARVAQAATAAIQSLGSAQTEALALSASRSPNVQVRRAALRIIAYFGYAAGLDAMLAAADEPDDRLRDAAVAGLAFVDDPRAASALLSACRHSSAKTRAATARALGQLQDDDGRAAVALRELLADDDAWVRYYACQALGKRRDSSATDALVALLADPAGQVRVAAVEALSQLRTDGALAALRTAVRSDDGDMQRAAIVGLGLRKQADALPILVDAATSPDPATRLVALAALAELDGPQVIAVLRRAALDGDESVRLAAVEHLSTRKSPLATDALIELLGEAAPRDRVVAALALPSDGRIASLMQALETATESAAPLLVAALMRAQRADANAAIVSALLIDNVFSRRAAAEALAQLRAPGVRAALERASVDDPDSEVRRIASLALGG